MEAKKTGMLQPTKGTKKKYVCPEIREVWSENIGMKGTFLLEM